MILVDTNVLLDVLEDDPVWASWSMHQLQTQSIIHELVINPIIYAELSTTFESVDALDGVIQTMGLKYRQLSTVSGIHGIRPVPAQQGHETQCPPRLLHRGACSRSWLGHPHP